MGEFWPSAADMCAIIEDEVTRSLYEPRDALTETMLAQRFGVSRFSARAALVRLAQTGVVEAGDKRKARISRISNDALLADLLLREILDKCLYTRILERRPRPLRELAQPVTALQHAAQESSTERVWACLLELERQAWHLSEAEYMLLYEGRFGLQLRRVEYLMLEHTASRIAAEKASLMVTIEMGNKRALESDLAKHAFARRADVGHARKLHKDFFCAYDDTPIARLPG